MADLFPAFKSLPSPQHSFPKATCFTYFSHCCVRWREETTLFTKNFSAATTHLKVIQTDVYSLSQSYFKAVLLLEKEENTW